MTSHKALLILTSLLLSFLDSPSAGSDPHGLSTPVITYVGDVSDHDRGIVEAAIDRIAEAGLQLPDLTISFPVNCDGRAGRYFVGQNRVELCRVSLRLVLHELAHAWDDNNAVDRQRFMEQRGIDHWYENGGPDSGGEQLAHVIAWGLLDVDTSTKVFEYAGQPIDEQPSRLVGVPNADREELNDLFRMVVGVEPFPSRLAVEGA